MKKLKLIIALLLFSILFTGCNVKYNLQLNEDYSLDESLESKNSISFFREYEFFTPKQVLENSIAMEKEKLDEFHYKYSISDDNVVTLNNHYNHFKDYFMNNPIYQQYFTKLNYEENGNIVTIQNDGEFIPYTEGNPSYYGIDYIDINIQLPFKVLKHNADKVDKKNNIYTWTIRKSTKEKSFLLKFDQSRNAISENKIEDSVFLIILVSLIGLVIGTIIWVYMRYKSFD